MAYDPLNQLIEVRSQREKTEFIYDPLGRRLAKVISIKAVHGWEESMREYYLYDGNEEMRSFNLILMEKFSKIYKTKIE